MSLLDALERSGRVRTVDIALARSLYRAYVGLEDAVALAAALASHAVSQGHAGFELARPLGDADASDLQFPSLQEWDALLRASPAVACGAIGCATNPDRALVLEEGRVYLRRYRDYEHRLATAMTRLAGATVNTGTTPELNALHALLFPGADHDDAQAAAARHALAHPVTLITGGPGTGKTTTVARVLALLAAQSPVNTRIALAAPTGRAADRMATSVRRVAAQLREQGVDAAICDALPARATTLHRLLGLVPGRAAPRANELEPLALDVLVVDETSMVDLPLMCKLLEALPTGTRLLLLGDPHQLQSVDAGDVLAALVDAADAPPSIGAPLAGRRVHLLRGYRQTATLQLDALGAAVRNGDATATLLALRDSASGVHWHEGSEDPLVPELRDALLEPWRELARCASPEQALELLHRARLLTALRSGPQGATALNARIEHVLAGAHRDTHFHGRLVLMGANDARSGVFNGDVGVCLKDASGTRVWFESDAGPRSMHPAALPAHTSAFATTVHKAQGSEFDTVWLVLPRVDARVLTRELLYTALTRGRNALHVHAPAAVIESSLARHERRVSGLSGRLGSMSATR